MVQRRLLWRSRRFTRTACRAQGALAVCLAACVGADQSLELPSVEFPIEGAIGPDTYLSDASLTSCALLDPYPLAVEVPYGPTVEQARAFCSTKANCGGFVYTTAAAAAAQGGALPYISAATYCRPRSFVAGTASSTSGVAFVRHVYGSCDIRISLSSSTSTFYGALVATRNACIQPGRGLSTAQDRRARPRTRRYERPPKAFAKIGGTSYEVGKEVFISEAAAQNASIDGTAHIMTTATGVQYYMPGATHDTREQSARPVERDGWFPLYLTQASAQAASLRSGGNGQAQSVGPTTAFGQPSWWAAEPQAQVYYMPTDAPGDSVRLFYGDYVYPFSVDGYFPLYRNKVDAEKAATSGAAQGHGPKSDTGHPLAWSTGETQIFYMPTEGPQKYYGTYVEESEATAPKYSYVIPARSLDIVSSHLLGQLQNHRTTGPAGEGPGADSAAQVYAAIGTPANTEAAAATLLAAPAWSRHHYR
mmetsp:Transcript_6728/g.12227  ORF Transcript_6728/g.12227 Transcript_6728/m.12227 type:complete len:477 (+) Transcript_6728:151-1581(+)